MEAEPVSKGVEIGFTVYEFLAPVLAAALAWVSARLAGWIRTKAHNELAAGMLIRLQESVVDAVKAVNQRSRELLEEARDPDSDGGVKLTKREAQNLKTAALGYVRDYWGPRGLQELSKVLGFGTGTELDRMLGTKIESVVGDLKRNTSNGNPS